jgi:hypothetical protein
MSKHKIIIEIDGEFSNKSEARSFGLIVCEQASKMLEYDRIEYHHDHKFVINLAVDGEPIGMMACDLAQIDMNVVQQKMAEAAEHKLKQKADSKGELEEPPLEGSRSFGA